MKLNTTTRDEAWPYGEINALSHTVLMWAGKHDRMQVQRDEARKLAELYRDEYERLYNNLISSIHPDNVLPWEEEK